MRARTSQISFPNDTTDERHRREQLRAAPSHKLSAVPEKMPGDMRALHTARPAGCRQPPTGAPQRAALPQDARLRPAFRRRFLRKFVRSHWIGGILSYRSSTAGDSIHEYRSVRTAAGWSSGQRGYWGAQPTIVCRWGDRPAAQSIEPPENPRFFGQNRWGRRLAQSLTGSTTGLGLEILRCATFYYRPQQPPASHF